jgi:hypothetical protein
LRDHWSAIRASALRNQKRSEKILGDNLPVIHHHHIDASQEAAPGLLQGVRLKIREDDRLW